MKKWLLLLVGLLCCASLAWAGFGYQVQMAGSVPAVGASYACDASTADICEDWDDADTFRLTWTDVTTGGTISAAAHAGTLSCTDKGSQAITLTYSSQADLYARTDLGSAQAVLYGSVYFIITDRPNAINGTYRTIIAGGGQTDGSSAGIRISIKESTSDQLQVGAFYNSTTQLGTFTNINEDTWYRVSFLRSSDGNATNANDTVTWWLNGSEQATVTNADLVLVQHPRYITLFNRDEVAESIGTSVQIDNLELDYSEMPSA